MVCDILIDSRIDRSRTESVWDDEQEKHPIFLCRRKSEQSQYRQEDGYDHDPFGMESADQLRAEDRRNNRHETDRHGNVPGV